MSQEDANVVDTEVTNIESAESVVETAPQEAETTETPEKTETEKTVEKSEEKGDTDKGDGFVPFPKKARNAISYRDKQIAKLKTEISELKKAQAQPEPEMSSAPKEGDFDDYASFLKAQILHELQGQQPTQEQPKEASAQDLQQQQLLAQKQHQMALKSQEYAQSIPDYAEIMNENAEMLNYLPEEIQNVFYEADDAALAVYNLAKTGDLALLAQMTPYKAAMVIAQAQAITPPSRPAPPPPPKHMPMTGAKGTGKAGKSVADMTADEIVKKYNL